MANLPDKKRKKRDNIIAALVVVTFMVIVYLAFIWLLAVSAPMLKPS